MNNFIFENSTKVFFGRGYVKEYLACLTKGHDTILLVYGGGSVKENGIYDEVMSILKAAGKKRNHIFRYYEKSYLRDGLRRRGAGKGESGRNDPRCWRRLGYGFWQGSFYCGPV